MSGTDVLIVPRASPPPYSGREPAFQYTVRHPAMRDMDRDAREAANEQRDRELEDFISRISEALGIGPIPTPIPNDLDDLDDVDAPPPLTDGYVLTWDASTGMWVARAVPTPEVPEPEVVSTDLSDGAGWLYYGPTTPDGAGHGALWVVTRIDLADVPSPPDPVTTAPTVTISEIANA